MVSLAELGRAERAGWTIVPLPLGCPSCGASHQLARSRRGRMLITCPSCERAHVLPPDGLERAIARHPAGKGGPRAPA